MVILVIVAIAIPNVLQAKMRANEAAAVASMNTIHTAEILYSSTYPQTGFAGNLADLGRHGSNCQTPGKTNSCLIADDALTSGVKDGYMFELVGDGSTPVSNYTLTATPLSTGTTGRCTYSSGQSGQISVVNQPSGGRFSAGSSPCSL
jgi:hypothetical protein